MKKIKRILFLTLVIAMATILSVNMPIHAAAEDGKIQYIEDVVVVYGSSYADAKSKLDEYSQTQKKKYYPVEDNTLSNNAKKEATEDPINITSKGIYVLVGYSVTTNKQDAITDMAIMNMTGAFDFDDEYSQILEEQKQEMHVKVEKMRSAFELFAENVEEARENNKDTLATLGYEVLQKYYNDDIIDEDTGNPITIAKMITNIDDYTDEQVDNMFMQMSGMAFMIIEQYVFMGCLTNWVKEAKTVSADAQYTPQDYEKAKILLALMPTFQENIAKYKAGGVSYNSSQADIQNYINSLTSSEDKQFFVKYACVEGNMRSTYLKDGVSYYDIFMQDTTSETVINSLLPIAYCIDDDYSCLLGITDLADFYTFGYSVGEDISEIRERVNVNMVEEMSVYAGVDRSLFDANGIGVTDSANNSITSTNKKLVDTKKTLDSMCVGFFLGSLVAGAIAIICLTTGISTIKSLKVAATATYVIEFSQKVSAPAATPFLSTMAGGIFMTVIGVIFIAAFCALITFAILASIRKKEVKAIIKRIPRVMVDSCTNDDGTRNLTYYYCAKDTNGNNADLNLIKDNCLTTDMQWIALYYTKDASAGNPLTTEKIRLVHSQSEVMDTAIFMPVHGFGETVAYNTGSYSGAKNAVATYFGFSRDTSPKEDETIEKNLPGATSVVSGTNALWFFGGGILGAGLALGGISLVKNKKKKSENIA